MENKPIETTYVEVGDKIEIRQVTINVCDQNDLKNVKGQWEKQRDGLKRSLTSLKKLDDEFKAVKDEATLNMITRIAIQAGIDVPSSDKLEILQKQIDNLDNEIVKIAPYIK